MATKEVMGKGSLPLFSNLSLFSSSFVFPKTKFADHFPQSQNVYSKSSGRYIIPQTYLAQNAEEKSTKVEFKINV